MSAVDDYQAATEQLAADTAREVLALNSEGLPPNETVLLIAAAINRANASAVTLADVWLSVQIEELAGQPVPTVGVLPVDSSERLVKAATTVLSDQFVDTNTKIGDHFGDAPKVTASNSRQNAVTPDQIADIESPANVSGMRLERLARSEVFETAQNATHEAMQEQDLIEGWVRHMDADPCQLCRWWWRDGRVWPKAHPMPTHKGCNCTQRVVLTESVASTGFTRRLERNT
ncbi:structural protein [Mycolicibacterium palauense]|uniref:hypothetical protein n=1 Tax=Mycolicibacterium palauense TaxID=2034511 RepID=UPI000BFEB00A|nr:hypothetical protein [Mycolicibacterium palauense]